MARALTIQQTRVMWVLGALAMCLLLVQPIRALAEPAGNDPGNPAIKESALWPVFVWCWCWPLAFAKAEDEKSIRRFHRRGIQFAWAFGCLLLLLHIAAAFHLGHGWSLEAAWRHTQRVSGFGDGIYVNYAVMMVWLADAVWLCVAFESYFARPRWLHWSVHAFIAFVMFNAAVVFGGWQSRALFAAVFLFTLVVFALRRKADAERPPPSAE